MINHVFQMDDAQLLFTHLCSEFCFFCSHCANCVVQLLDMTGNDNTVLGQVALWVSTKCLFTVSSCDWRSRFDIMLDVKRLCASVVILRYFV